MKNCPRCKALAFDDAEVCYECMYRFDEPEKLEPVSIDDVEEADMPSQDPSRPACPFAKGLRIQGTVTALTPTGQGSSPRGFLFELAPQDAASRKKRP